MLIRLLTYYLLCGLLSLNLVSCTNPKNSPKNTVSHHYKVYFLENKKPKSFKLVALKRSLNRKPKLEDVISDLLAGPNKSEQKVAYGTEIPPHTRLLSIKEEKSEVKINLSSDFVQGGGSQTMLTRHAQILKTIQANAPTKSVYILVEGKQIDHLGGEGLILNQPVYQVSQETP